MAPIADHLHTKELRELHSHGTRVTIRKGWSLIWELTPADKAYLILSGEVSVRRGGREIARLGAGDIVGETAIVNHKLRSASVVAETDLEVIHFTAEALTELSDRIPALEDALRATAAERLGVA